MPERPRQHVTEDASRRAFERLLPPEWIYRQLTHDYGIDGEVEVFLEGHSTGLTFKVQLKGTEVADSSVVRLSREKAAYYAALTEPVLIVLHHVDSGRTYARWYQSFDPALDLASENSIGLRFSGEDELSPERVRRLHWDVETARRLADPTRALPLRLAVSREDSTIAGTPTASIALAFRDAVARYPDVLTLADPADETLSGIVYLRRDSVRVDCRSLTSATVHYPYPWRGDSDPDLVLHDAMMALGLILNRMGQYDAASQFFAEFTLGSSVSGEDEVVATVASALARTHRMPEALAILEGLTDEKAAARMLLAMSTIWTAHPHSLTNQERGSVIEYLVRQTAVEEKSGNAKRAAIAHYNLANRLRVLGQQEEAIEHFRKAAELDPTYPDRDYYAGEFAGALFESGDFQQSVQQYRLAAHADPERNLPLLADALMMAGEYREASNVFRQALSGETSSRLPAEWRLKLRVLGRVLEFGGDHQTRNLGLAFGLADVSDPVLTEKDRGEQLARSLAADALCALAWFNLGLLDSREGHLDEAFVAFVAAGVISRFDLEAFARALVIGLILGDELVPDVVRTACYLNRTGFIRYLTHELQVSDQDVHSALLEFVEAVLTDEAAEELAMDETVEFRFIDDKGAYEAMEIRLERRS